MWTLESNWIESRWNGTLPSQLGGGRRRKIVSLGGDTASQEEMIEIARVTRAELHRRDPSARVILRFRGHEVSLVR